jgi:hypothetical protein
LIGQWLGRCQGEDAFPTICGRHTASQDRLEQGAMGGKAGGVGQGQTQGHLWLAGQGRQVLAKRIIQGPDSTTNSMHHQETGDQRLGQRSQVVNGIRGKPLNFRDGLPTTKRTKKPHLAGLVYPQDQTRHHPVVDGLLG